MGALAAISVRNVWLGWYEARRSFLWIATVLANLAVSIWWIDSGYQLTATTGPGRPVEFLWINVLAAATLAIASFWVERQAAARAAAPVRGVAYHRFAAWVIVAVLVLTTTGGLLGDVTGNHFQASAALGWGAWLAAVVVAVVCWWDARTRWPVACLYSVGYRRFVGRVELGDSFDFETVGADAMDLCPHLDKEAR